MKIHTYEPFKEEVTLPDAVVGFVIFANDGEYHPDCEFCDCFGRIGWYAGDFDSEACGGLKIYVVVACTPQGYVFLPDYS